MQIRRPSAQPKSEIGDGEQFAALAPQHVSTMLRAAAALVGVADAEDATQEALMRAWQGWSGLRDTTALRAWLLRITVNVCRDWQRGRFGTGKRLMEPLDAGRADHLIATLGSDPGASDHTAALDLRQAVNSLEVEYRVIVLLRYYAGMDATEVGAALGIPPATVRTRLRRALSLLRERLGPSGSQPSFPYQEGSY